MKKCLLVLLVLFCAFAAFAADAYLDVTLNVGKSGPYVAFTDSYVNAFTTTFAEVTEKKHDTANVPPGSNISGSVYATITTNSATKEGLAVTVSWTNLKKKGITTDIPLHISSKAVYINGTSYEQTVADSTSSVILTEPESSNTTGPRAISHKLDYVIKAEDYLKATSATGYETTLTLTATYE